MNENSETFPPQANAAICRTFSPLADEFFFSYVTIEQVARPAAGGESVERALSCIAPPGDKYPVAISAPEIRMTLNERITSDLKAAMKSGDSLKLNTIRSIRAQIIELSKRGNGETVTPEDELTALLSSVKKRKEAIEMYEKAGRKDLAGQEQKELEIIRAYLPQQMSREEAENVIANIISRAAATSIKDLGKVMPLAMKELKGKVEGSIIQEIVKSRLGNS
jgi:uncharacterized protein YqeY